MAKRNKKQIDQELNAALYDDFDKFEHWVMENWRGIFFVCGAVIVIVTVVAIVMQIQQSKKLKMDTELANAKTIDELEKVIAKFKNLPDTNNARIRLSNLLREEKQYDKAISVLKQLNASPETTDEIKWRSKLNIAYLYELKGDKKMAADTFSYIGNNSGMPHDVRNEANYGAGRLYFEQNDTQKARNALKYVIAEQPDTDSRNPFSFWRELARKLMNHIEAFPADDQTTVKKAPEKETAKTEPDAKKADDKKQPPRKTAGKKASDKKTNAKMVPPKAPADKAAESKTAKK